MRQVCPILSLALILKLLIFPVRLLFHLGASSGVLRFPPERKLLLKRLRLEEDELLAGPAWQGRGIEASNGTDLT